MQIDPGMTALALLTGQPATSQATNIAELAASTAKQPYTAMGMELAPGITYAPDSSWSSHDRASFERALEIAAEMEQYKDDGAKLLDGSMSAFDPTTLAAKAWSRLNTDLRMEFEGAFPPTESARMGSSAKTTRQDADFLSRSDAMAQAYHFASAIVRFATETASEMTIVKANTDTMLDASGQIYGLDGRLDSHDLREKHGTQDIVRSSHALEQNLVVMAKMFSLDTTSVTDPTYDGSFHGFSIAHGTLGKIMDVDANGAITLYDAEGKAWSAEDYAAARVDGGIPQLHNDLIRQADDRALRASWGVRA